MDEQEQTGEIERKPSTGVVVDPADSVECTHCGAAIATVGLEPFSSVTCPSCGHQETVAARLGTFRLLRLLGTGGMGGVYYAKDESLGRFVAIKVMLESVGQDEKFVETFRREAQAAAKLNHPHIAQIYSFGQEKGQPYIVMELVPGKGLDKLIESGKPLNQSLVMQIGLEIAEGLEAADEIGLMHGDIKPENILLDDKMSAKLVDFGIATYVSQAQPDGIWGTPYYIAPEKVTRQPVGAHTDIYSLGATLFHSLANRPPFEGDSPVDVVKARLDRPAPPLREVRPDIHESVENIVARMLQAEPAMRYPTYASLISDMRKVMKELGPSPRDTGLLSGVKAKKVVIKKRGKSVLTGKLSLTTAAVPAVAPDGQEEAPESPEAIEARRQRRRKAVKAVVWLVLVAVLVTGGVFGWTRYQAKKESEHRRIRETLALASARRQASEAFGELVATVKTISEMAQSARTLAVQATNSVSLMLGEELAIPTVRLEDVLPPSEPEPEPEPEPVAESEPAATGGVTSETAMAETETNGMASAEGAEAGPEPAEGGPGAEIVETAAEGGDTNQAAEPAAEPEPAVEAAESEPVAVEPEPEVADVPIVAAAKRVIAGAVSLRGDTLRAGHIQVETRGVLDQVNETPDSRSAVRGEADIEAGKEKVRDLACGAERTLRETEDAARTVETLRKEFEREAAERHRREEEERRLGKIEEEQNRLEDERLQKIEGERGRVEGLREANAGLLRQHRFAEAGEAVEAERASFETREGRQAVRTLHERYTRLRDMKSFLVERLSARPFRWGWGWGTAATDVLGATEAVVKTRSRQVPWSDVNAAQMMKFLQHYLLDEDLGLRQRADQNLAAAIYCHEVIGTEAARRAAMEYVEKAVTLMSTLADDAERLVPTE